ncbi:MAG: thiamine phosphate synthase, partial [Pseudomonadota bacterium]
CSKIVDAAEVGLVSSCILYQGTASDSEFSQFCGEVTPALQARDVAVLVADDTQVFGRCGADGLFLEKTRGELDRAIERFSPEKIIGCGGFKNRDGALRLGELKPDFVLFGKLGGDIRPEAHPKNLTIADWWSEMVEIPGIILAGNAIESIIECSQTGADFVAAETCVFSHPEGPAAAVKHIEQLLEEHAPRFEEAEG